MTDGQRLQLLASELGGAVAEDEDGGMLVYGDWGGLVYTVGKESDASLVIALDLPPGQDAESLRQTLLEAGELHRAVAVAHGLPVTLGGMRTSEDKIVLEWHPSRGRPDLDLCGPVVQALIKAVLDKVAAAPRACEVCAAESPPVVRAQGRTLRLCSDCLLCREQADLAGQKLAAASAAAAEQAGGGLAAIPLQGHLGHTELDALSRCLERKLQESPGKFRRQLLRFVLLGQFALAAHLLALTVIWLLLAALGAAVILGDVIDGTQTVASMLAEHAPRVGLWITFFVATCTALWQSLSARMHRPKAVDLHGLRLEKEQEPSLYAWLERTAETLQAPCPDLVLLTSGLDCAAIEVRQGLRGYQRVLVLGLPLLRCLDLQEVRAVVGHELSHLKEQDSRSAWIYRTTWSWVELASRLRVSGQAPGLLYRFAYWFVPRFYLRAQIVERENEKRADRAALALMDQQDYGRLLLKVQLFQVLSEEALSEALLTRLRGQSEAGDFTTLLTEGFTQLPEPRRERALRRLLDERSSWLDSHPVLGERLQALGCYGPFEMSLRAPEDTAEPHLLKLPGELRETVLQAQEEAVSTRAVWLGRLMLGARRRGLLEVEVSPAGWLRRARDLRLLGDFEAALTALDQALELQPDHLGALQERLSLWLEQGHTERASAGWKALLERPEGESDPSLLLEAAGFFAELGETFSQAVCLRRLLELEPPEEIRLSLTYQLERLELSS